MRRLISLPSIPFVLAALALLPASAQAAAPSIDPPIASKVSTESARLEAKIFPNGKTTSYHFEYGPADCSSNPCTSIPIPDGKVSGALSSAVASADLEGLTPATTYHFRVVAQNNEGTAQTLDRRFRTASAPFPPEQLFGPCPNDALRTEHPSANLPDCRAYEQASPIDKNGLDAIGEGPWVKASLDGDRVSFLTTDGLPGGQGAQELPAYLSSRGASNWSTQGLLPPASLGSAAKVLGWSADFSRVFDSLKDFGPSEASFLQRLSLDGSLTPIVPLGAGLEFNPSFIGTSADGSKVLFESGSKLLPEANAKKTNVYLWDSSTGQLHLASALNDGKAPAKGAFGGAYDWIAKRTPVSFEDHPYYYAQDNHAVTADGSLYFSEEGSGRLYLRRNPAEQRSQLDGEGNCTEAGKACTVLVSASQRGTPDPTGAQPAAFMGATPDGSKVFLTSSEELTPDANTGPEQPPALIGRSDLEGKSIQASFLPATAAGIAVHDGYVYWANTLKGTIGRQKLGPSGPEGPEEPEYVVPGETKAINHKFTEPGVFHFAPTTPRYVAAQGEYVYWTNTGPLGENINNGSQTDIVRGAGTIGRAKIGATEAEEIKPEFITGATDPQGIAVDSEFVYWANAGDGITEGGTVGRANLDGTGVNQIFVGLSLGEMSQGLALDASHVYWAVFEPNGSNNYLFRADLDGSNLKFRGIGAGSDVRGVAVDAGHLYWVSEAKGTIGRIALADLSEPAGNCKEIPSCEREFIKDQGRPVGVATDASHIYWSTNGEPHPNPGNDLYRYDAETGELTDVAPDSSDEAGADVLGVLGASDDGSYVYFAANADLDEAGPALPGNCQGSAAGYSLTFTGTCSLYLAHAGTIQLIAPLNAEGNAKHSDALNWMPRGEVGENTDYHEKTARVSPDGLTLLFRSQGKLTAYDNEGEAELYRYRVGDSGPTCVSCNPTGISPTAIPTAGVNLKALQPTKPAFVLSRVLSKDGNRVFFTSTDRLAIGDVNGEEGCPTLDSMWSNPPACQDVYEWEAKGTGSCEEDVQGGGCLYLLSSGKSGDPSFLVDASADGDNAFLITRSQLVPQDQDLLYDVYDARVGGGLTAQNQVPPVPCEGEACKVGASTPPTIPSPGTPSFSGPSDPKPKHKAHKRKGRKAKKRGHHKHKHHRQAAKSSGKKSSKGLS